MKSPQKREKNQAPIRQLEKIVEIQSRLAAANFDLNEFMQLIVKEMQQLTPANGVVIELVEGSEMVYRAGIGSVEKNVGLRLPINNSISGLCVNSQEVLISDDTENDNRVNLAACRKIGARSLVVAPLFHEGKAVGVLKIVSDQANGFKNKDVQTLQLMAGFIGSALAHQMLYEKNQKLLIERTQAVYELETTKNELEYRAQHDYLTNLPNRNLFDEHFKQAINNTKETNQLYALVYIDIDHFKIVNDNLGHAIGDEVLKAFAIRLKQCIRSSDTVARLGGDEFLLILKIDNPYYAVTTGQKIIERMKEAFKFHDQVLNITASIGITYFQGNVNKPDELVKQADQALYYAKSTGRNNFQIFEKLNDYISSNPKTP